MSRFVEGDGEELWPNQGLMFDHNVRQALKGKRGRRALAELREALLHLPEPRLIANALCTVNSEKRRPEPITSLVGDSEFNREMAELEEENFARLIEQGEGVCAVGAYVWWQRVKGGMDPQAAFDSLDTLADYDDSQNAMDETIASGKAAGLAGPLAFELFSRNDDWYNAMSPEERHAAFLSWIDRELAGGTAA
jgi:hypothetical protein